MQGIDLAQQWPYPFLVVLLLAELLVSGPQQVNLQVLLLVVIVIVVVVVVAMLGSLQCEHLMAQLDARVDESWPH